MYEGGQNMATAIAALRDAPKTPKRRKTSRYAKCVGKHLKELRKKHPRTKQTSLLKKAHACAKRERKKKGW